MEKEHSKNMSKIQLQYEAKVEKASCHSSIGVPWLKSGFNNFRFVRIMLTWLPSWYKTLRRTRMWLLGWAHQEIFLTLECEKVCSISYIITLINSFSNTIYHYQPTEKEKLKVHILDMCVILKSCAHSRFQWIVKDIQTMMSIISLD